LLEDDLELDADVDVDSEEAEDFDFGVPGLGFVGCRGLKLLAGPCRCCKFNGLLMVASPSPPSGPFTRDSKLANAFSLSFEKRPPKLS
jgi:hypothetical protein